MLRLIQRKGSNIEVISSLQAFGTAGETISLTFEITDDEHISELQMRAEEPNSTNSEINVEIFVVKIWQAAGVGIYQSTSLLVEELLLKDDRIDLNDGYRKEVDTWRNVLKPTWFYEAPKLPTHKDARTTLGKGEYKTFLVRIKISDDAKPAVYETQVTCVEFGNNHGFAAESHIHQAFPKCRRYRARSRNNLTVSKSQPRILAIYQSVERFGQLQTLLLLAVLHGEA
ncbi:MAG: hypothetical protein HYX67_02785 [Candidatus Melainabacteria bacterium]|nr:hypothetical protein [Candidatus Melainabacteria bacterium]